MTDASTLDALTSRIAAADWFSRLGAYRATEGRLALRDLSAWDGTSFTPDTDPSAQAIAQDMDWLPTSREQPDPFDTAGLPARDARVDQAACAQVLEVCRITLKSLRQSTARGGLRSGPNDFTVAAEGAALYCARKAAIEIVLGEPGPWTGLLDLYLAGHWPCGLMPSGDVVVY